MERDFISSTVCETPYELFNSNEFRRWINILLKKFPEYDYDKINLILDKYISWEKLEDEELAYLWYFFDDPRIEEEWNKILSSLKIKWDKKLVSNSYLWSDLVKHLFSGYWFSFIRSELFNNLSSDNVFLNEDNVKKSLSNLNPSRIKDKNWLSLDNWKLSKQLKLYQVISFKSAKEVISGVVTKIDFDWVIISFYKNWNIEEKKVFYDQEWLLDFSDMWFEFCYIRKPSKSKLTKDLNDFLDSYKESYSDFFYDRNKFIDQFIVNVLFTVQFWLFQNNLSEIAKIKNSFDDYKTNEVDIFYDRNELLDWFFNSVKSHLGIAYVNLKSSDSFNKLQDSFSWYKKTSSKYLENFNWKVKSWLSSLFEKWKALKKKLSWKTKSSKFDIKEKLKKTTWKASWKLSSWKEKFSKKLKSIKKWFKAEWNKRVSSIWENITKIYEKASYKSIVKERLIWRLRKTISQLEEDKLKLQNALKTAESKVNSLLGNVSRLKDEIKSLSDYIKKLEDRNVILEKELLKEKQSNNDETLKLREHNMRLRDRERDLSRREKILNNEFDILRREKRSFEEGKRQVNSSFQKIEQEKEQLRAFIMWFFKSWDLVSYEWKNCYVAAIDWMKIKLFDTKTLQVNEIYILKLDDLSKIELLKRSYNEWNNTSYSTYNDKWYKQENKREWWFSYYEDWFDWDFYDYSDIWNSKNTVEQFLSSISSLHKRMLASSWTKRIYLLKLIIYNSLWLDHNKLYSLDELKKYKRRFNSSYHSDKVKWKRKIVYDDLMKIFNSCFDEYRKLIS